MTKTTFGLLLLILCSACASKPPATQANRFLSKNISEPKTIGNSKVQSRYWKYKDFLVHFITNANEKNRNQTPIIYVHGLGGSLDEFFNIIKTLHPDGDSRPYYAIDLPPHGGSALQGTELSIQGYVETLREFISMLPNDKVNLVCHSMGGQVCIGFALTNPKQIDLLTLLSPAGIYQKSEFVSDALKNFAGINIGSVEDPATRDVGDLGWYVQEINSKLITNDPLLLIAIESFRTNFHHEVKELKTRTLVIWGREDKVFSFENGLFLNENIKDSTLYIVDKAGHVAFKTHGPLVAKLIEKHLLRRPNP